MLDDYADQLKHTLADDMAKRQLTPNAKQLIKRAPDLLQAKISKSSLDKRTVGEFINRKLAAIRQEIDKLR